MLDHVIHLMTFSDIHKNWTTEHISRIVIPPVNLEQCIGVVEDGHLLAWASWALMDDKSADKFLDGCYTLEPESWSSGSRLVFIDIIAPFGHTRKIIRMCRNLFPDCPKAEWRRHSKQRRFGAQLHV
tara:strand:+ start:3613 stop:3993 length:381 start_codon:yes stop_codon:yes gene_type:complete